MYIIYEKVWQQKPIIYAYVVADLAHRGHLQFLKEAKKQGGKLIVGVLTDKATQQKKPPPIMNYTERADLISEWKCVDQVVIQDDYSPLNNVIAIKPNILIESDSHQEQPANSYVKSYGGKVIIIPYYQHQSSTKIKEKILKQWGRPKNHS